MADETSIQVNFARAVPLFPLDTAVLLPQQVLPLHVFEPRYRQLVEDVLDGPGQFALSVFKGEAWKQNYHGRPPLMPATCLAQIAQHERLPDGRFNLLVQGVCRARIAEELPAESERLYRLARLEPVGVEDQEPKLYGVRERLKDLLEDGPLTQLVNTDWVVERIHNEEIPPSVILELVSFALLTDRRVRYRLLAEGDADERADLVQQELVKLQRLLRRAEAQHPEEWPKGVSWN